MTSWEDFVSRRSINFENFKSTHGISTKEDLERVCVRFNVQPPSELKMNALFPPLQPQKNYSQEDPVNVNLESKLQEKDKENQKLEDNKSYKKSKKGEKSQ